MTTPFKLSVAIPIYNEEEVLPELLRRLTAVLDGLEGGPHEVVLVDDGSQDRSREILDRAAARDSRLVVVHLSRNFGHQVALAAALDHVTGSHVAVLDGDLQDPPEEIPRFLAKMREGYDVVYAVRKDRKESWWLRLCYALFYRLSAALSAIPLPLDSGDFALLSRQVVDHMKKVKERNRYLRGVRAWVGLRQTGLAVERAPRFAGKPKYSTLSLIKLALDGIFAFSFIPLRVAGFAGLIAITVAIAYALYTLYVKFFLGISPQGFAAIVFLLVFLSGVQLLFLGVIGEYLGRVYEEVQRRPHYLVERIVRAAPASRRDET